VRRENGVIRTDEPLRDKNAYFRGGRILESCLRSPCFDLCCLLSITTEYTIRRIRVPVWVSRYDSHFGSHPSVLISDTLFSSASFCPNLITLVSFPTSPARSSLFLISPPNQLPSNTPAIGPLTAHGSSERKPAERKTDPPERPITSIDRLKPESILRAPMTD
jgi:hypothetical protein